MTQKNDMHTPEIIINYYITKNVENIIRHPVYYVYLSGLCSILACQGSFSLLEKCREKKNISNKKHKSSYNQAQHVWHFCSRSTIFRSLLFDFSSASMYCMHRMNVYCEATNHFNFNLSYITFIVCSHFLRLK